jgi:GntR family transcriptional regulator
MPSVRELAMELRVSLITIRRAYAELEQAGLVVRRQGQGTFVADNVGAAARRQARQDAREALERGVDRALDLGLSRGEVESFVHQHLEDRGGSDA